MSLATVRQFFATHAPDIAIIESDTSTATVALAAAAHGVAPGQIAKTLSLRISGNGSNGDAERIVLVVVRGDARLDNGKLRRTFGGKVSMLDAASVEAATGHPVGGVCPFGLPDGLPVYCDVSLQAYDEVLPAAGGVHTAVRIAPQRIVELVGASWVDVVKDEAAPREVAPA